MYDITYTLEKSLLVKLRSFQKAFFEIRQNFFIYQQSRFTVKKLICKVQNENSFTVKRFPLTLERNRLTNKGSIARHTERNYGIGMLKLW